MISRADVLTNPRWAGCVERYHTWPTLQKQNVGEHTWQVMVIWFQIFGPLSPEESAYVLWHDGGELVTGDPPFPVKANNPNLKATYDALEANALVGMLGVNPMRVFTTQTKHRAKLCDLLEMYEFGLCELALGNRLAQPIIDDMKEEVLKLCSENLPEALQRVCAYIKAVAARYPS
jgi:5'-deoxynucleotidase YfbR-like HD superfamily hydrolase